MKMTESTETVDTSTKKTKSDLDDLEIIKFLKSIDWDAIARRIRNGVNLVGKALVYIAEKLLALGKYLSEV